MAYKNPFNNSPNNNEGSELEFKRHNIFFDELETNINEIRRIAEMAMFEPKILNLYFSKIYSLTVFYEAYLNLEKQVFWFGDYTDKKNRKFKLDSIKNSLFGKDYINSLDNIDNMEKNYRVELNEKQKKIFTDLNKIMKELAKQLSYSELRPKPIKHVEEEYEGVDNNVVKEIIRGFRGVVER